MSDLESRAEKRRNTWQSAKAASHSEMSREDQRFWSSTTASQRFDAVWDMALEAWSLKRGAEPAPRLQGSPSGIRKRTG